MIHVEWWHYVVLFISILWFVRTLRGATRFKDGRKKVPTTGK